MDEARWGVWVSHPLLPGVESLPTYLNIIGKTKTGTINGAASLTDECGMYAMTVAIKPDPAPAPPAPPSGPRPLFAQICSPRGNGVLPFTRDQALDALTRYCPSEYIIPDKGKTYNFSQVEGTVSIEGSFGWSKAGQDGCNARTSNKFSQTDCKNLFMAAVDNCKPIKSCNLKSLTKC